MAINSDASQLIKSFEGCKLTAYPDPDTGGDPWTIGFGHTGPEVKCGLNITQAQADAYLAADLVKFEKAVDSAVKVKLTDNQRGALVSFTYSVGPANLSASTLLKKVNARDFKGAALEFGKWNKASGKVLTGLTRCRVVR